MLSILLVDDEPTLRLALGDALRAAGHEVILAADGTHAMHAIGERQLDVVVTDIRLPGVDGLTLFREVRRRDPSTEVILITAYGAVADAVAALKEGAYDYMTKPFDTEELILHIGRIEEHRRVCRELAAAKEALSAQTPDDIVGRSATMRCLLKRLDTIAASDAAVLISGASGTGKELLARRLHARSSRRDGPFVAVNCAVFPETLLEAELFGHERGAFTGAVKRRDGRFKAACGGTIFLDEIGEIPLLAQAKLLRVLQEGTIEPLGSDGSVAVDVRVITATHRNLKDRIAQGLFREDLYYRINVLDLAVPPLVERQGDMPLLVEYFLQKFAGSDRKRRAISPRAWAALERHPFPGNVRELEHAIQHAVVLAGGNDIDVEHLPRDIAGSATVADGGTAQVTRPLAAAVKEFEREYITRALDAAGGAKAKAAELLGISRKSLWEKLRDVSVSSSDVWD